MTNENSPRRRYWIPVLLILAYAGLVFWARISEHMMGPGFVFLGTIVGVFLGWIWFCFLSGRRGVVRWLGVMGGLVVVVGLVVSLRYEGSTDGSGMPRFVFKWSRTLDQQSQEALSAAATPEGPLTEDSSTLSYAVQDSLGFYGPGGTGILRDVSLAPETLESGPTLIWKQPIGLGWSSFAVSGRTAVTQEQRGEEEWVAAYDLESGTLLWRYSQNRRFSEAMGGDGPRATPCIHEGVVFALGATGVLDALDLSDGTPKWSYELLPRGAGNLMWGKAASPLYLPQENVVVVTGGTGGGPTVVAVNAETGEPVWKWGSEAASYASPVVATVLGERQLVVVNENTVVGLLPESGQPRWVFDWPIGMMNPSAKVGQPSVIDESQVLITASYGIGAVMFKVQEDGTGGMSTEETWHVKNRMKTKFSSALVHEGFAYGLDEGMLACIDLSNGKRAWKDGRYGYGQNLLVGDTVLVQAEDGDIAFVAADPNDFKEYGRFPGIEGKTWNVPTLAGEYLLVRNDREAACYRVKLVQSVPSP